MVWWGFWLIAVDLGAWWTVYAPVLVTFLLMRVSGAPLRDERLAQKPGAAAYLATTPAFVPRLKDLFRKPTYAGE
jgi:steroid 5-alpha reductase family enzyme